MMRQSVRRTPAVGVPRLGAMIALLVLVGYLMRRTSDPEMWTWLTGPVSEPVAMLPVGEEAARQRVNVDPSPEERAELDLDFKTVRDRTTMLPGDMPAYWRLMSWSSRHSFADLQGSARQDVLFTHLWERPAEWRGQLVRLKLQVRRVLSYDAGPNNQDIKTLYEAWGFTSDSQSFPYVIVFRELPPELPLGADIRAEVEFVGYFLKTMAYQAGDATRAAPMLIGQVRKIPTRGGQPAAAPANSDFSKWIVPLCLGALAISMAFSLRRLLAPARPVRASQLRDAAEDRRDDEDAARWLEGLNPPGDGTADKG